jgi:hypothetical protein
VQVALVNGRARTVLTIDLLIIHYSQQSCRAACLLILAAAGGIGQWEGAHGVDETYSYDPARGRGTGKIILTCLKGMC